MPICRSYAVIPDDAGDFTTPGTVADAVVDSLDQTVVWRDGTQTVYRASLGALDPLLSHAARAGGDGVLVANPYSGDRRMVLTAD